MQNFDFPFVKNSTKLFPTPCKSITYILHTFQQLNDYVVIRATCSTRSTSLAAEGKKSHGCIRFRLSPGRPVPFTLHFFFFCGPSREWEHVPGTPIHRAGFFDGTKANKNANPANQHRFRFPVPRGGHCFSIPVISTQAVH